MVVKIDIVGMDYYLILFKFIDLNEFFEYMGGKCKCEGYKGGCFFSNRGFWNDEKEY